jgi:pyoverdine/dityrosine biosynthesis protein Dit1
MKKGGIHINPKNKGKFNALKKRTGKSTEELTHSKNPLTRKRAIFAQNAKKWHHGKDGMCMNCSKLQKSYYGRKNTN